MNEIEKIVEKLANRMKICDQFSEITILKDKKMPFVAGVNAENNELFINLENGIIKAEDMIGVIEGIVTHEVGHVDSRLVCPSNLAIMKQHFTALRKKKISNEEAKNWLNIVYDLEIHHQYNKRNYINPILQRHLKKFITMTRNKCFQKNPDDLILSVEYPQTKEQQFVKSVIENRSLNVVEKVSKIIKKMKNKQNTPKTALTQVIGIDPTGKAKNNAKQSPKGIQIKKQIKVKNKENEAISNLTSLGFSKDEINFTLKKHNIDSIVNSIENLQQSMKNVLPNLEKEASLEKTSNINKDTGNRINGYKRLNDISDVTKNIEDMATIGKYDINEVRIPYMIERKCKATMIIIRDVSGSVSSPPFDKIIRDITVTLIETAKKNRHKIGVIDFHTTVEPVFDSKKNIITNEYNPILLDSMMLKLGQSTRMDLAINFLNKNIIEGREEIPMNIYIITDGEFDYIKQKINSKKFNLVGLQVKKQYSGTSLRFENFIEANNGKMFIVTTDKNDKLLSELYKDYRSG